MSIDYNLKCRACLNDTNTYYKTVDDAEESYNILDMLDSVVPYINIRNSMQYSNLVCEICVEKLLNSYKFQQMCIKSNNTLQDLFPVTAVEDENVEEENITDLLTAESEENDTEYNDDSSSCFSEQQSPVEELETTNSNKEEQIGVKKVRIFQCFYCPKTFEKQHSLAAHCRVHKKKELLRNKSKTIDEDYLVIEMQDSKFNASTDTEIGDIETSNTKPKRQVFPCKICGKVFYRVYSLRRHNSSVHSIAGSHECKICKKVFAYVHVLDQHLFVHKSSLCPHCGKTFGKNSLRAHVERCEGMKKYQCPDCPKRFNCKANLYLHTQAHSNTKPYSCDICGTRFTRKYSVLKHKKLVHEGERSFKCQECDMTFKQLHILKRHMFTHTGERPFKCKYCDCAYAQSGDLTKHLRRHVGENTYMCDQCPESFKYQVELRNHQSQHYKMEQKMTEEVGTIS